MKKHIYLPCNDLCTTMDVFFEGSDDFVSVSMMDNCLFGSFFDRLKRSWNVLRGKQNCFAELVVHQKDFEAFLEECKTACEQNKENL